MNRTLSIYYLSIYISIYLSVYLCVCGNGGVAGWVRLSCCIYLHFIYEWTAAQLSLQHFSGPRISFNFSALCTTIWHWSQLTEGGKNALKHNHTHTHTQSLLALFILRPARHFFPGSTPLPLLRWFLSSPWCQAIITICSNRRIQAHIIFDFDNSIFLYSPRSPSPSPSPSPSSSSYFHFH